MLFATFQSRDYMTKTQGEWRQDIKAVLGIPKDKNIYWCVPANSFEQFVLYSHVIEPNIPHLFVLFETDKFYRIDGIKWNQYVEDENCFPLSDDVLNIQYPNYSEYIVTDIPDRRIELDCDIADLFDHATEEGYNSISQKAATIICNNIKNNPELLGKIDYERQTIGGMLLGGNQEAADARRTYGEFLRNFIGFYYNIGLYALTGEQRQLKLLIITGQDYIEITNRKNSIFSKFMDADAMYSEYNYFFGYMYRKYFPAAKPSEKIYPNAFCPCGSGKKYKKCCMNKANVSLDEIMQ